MTDMYIDNTYKYMASGLENKLSKMQQTNINAKIVRNPSKTEDPKLYEVCQKFEALFIKQMLNTMKKTVHKNGLLHGGQAEEIF